MSLAWQRSEGAVLIVAALALALYRQHVATAIFVTIVGVSSVVDRVLARRGGWAPIVGDAPWPLYVAVLAAVLVTVWFF